MSFGKESLKKIETTLESITFLNKNEKITRYISVYYINNLNIYINIVLGLKQQSNYWE